MSQMKPVESWQKSVRQEYRTEQVNMISKVLASLEPSATPASKMMLASQFESAVFKSAPSFEEYGKIINKRLKKMQKVKIQTNFLLKLILQLEVEVC